MRRSVLSALKQPPQEGDQPLPHHSGGGHHFPQPKRVSPSLSHLGALGRSLSLGANSPQPAFKVPASTTSTRSSRLGATRSAATAGSPSSSTSKRSRVVFTENDFYETARARGDDDDDGAPAKKKQKKTKAKKDDDSDDDGGAGAKKGKFGFVDKYKPPPPPKQFPVYRPKTSESIISRAFTLPGLKKHGVLLAPKLSLRPLGTRQPGDVIPAPLHDPLAEHSIVLWDPTVDDREAEMERARLAAEKQALDDACLLYTSPSPRDS